MVYLRNYFTWREVCSIKTNISNSSNVSMKPINSSTMSIIFSRTRVICKITFFRHCTLIQNSNNTTYSFPTYPLTQSQHHGNAWVKNYQRLSHQTWLEPGRIPTMSEYRKAYREKLKAHPDKGGDTTVFQGITEAALAIFQFINKHQNKQTKAESGQRLVKELWM